MDIYYQGVNITEDVQIKNCIVNDAAGERCDSLTIEFENASSWYSWGPAEDDQIQVAHNGYDSGTMYVNRIRPEGETYTILATALPCKAREKGYQSFIGKTVKEIMRQCAMNSSMEYRLYGIDGNVIIPYIERSNKGNAGFLARMLMLEGAQLKCINGAYAAIGLEYAQSREPVETMELTASQEGMTHCDDGQRKSGIMIRTPYAKAYLTDTSEPAGRLLLPGSEIAPLTDIQAARWGKHYLMDHNRKKEAITVQSEFNPALTAMQRIDIEGAYAGEWLIQNVEHDLINLKSTVTMHRCIWSVQ